MKKILKKYSLAATLMAILCLLPASCITDDAPRRHRESNGDDDVYDEGGDG